MGRRMVILATALARHGFRNLRAAAMAFMMAAGASESLACGYDTDDVSLERIGLDIVYPEALSVLAAMERAETTDRPLSTPIVRQRAFAFYQTASSLERLATKLRTKPATGPLVSFTLVLVEPMLWTRFEIRPPTPGDPMPADLASKVSTQVHASGPQAGELLVVSGVKVIEQIARNRLSIAEARAIGFLRLDGSEPQKTDFMASYGTIGGEHARSLVKTNG